MKVDIFWQRVSHCVETGEATVEVEDPDNEDEILQKLENLDCVSFRALERKYFDPEWDFEYIDTEDDQMEFTFTPDFDNDEGDDCA